ncbi:Uncharacterised protein [Yersinia kristensenii]|nr:Uncharacterised protein [Yersinia kristensenii]CNL53361.1 Uncharacterised protein [Yersinia kristensenii]
MGGNTLFFSQYYALIIDFLVIKRRVSCALVLLKITGE